MALGEILHHQSHAKSSIERYESDYTLVSSGVPQGSIVGYLLFESFHK